MRFKKKKKIEMVTHRERERESRKPEIAFSNIFCGKNKYLIERESALKISISQFNWFWLRKQIKKKKNIE